MDIPPRDTKSNRTPARRAALSSVLTVTALTAFAGAGGQFIDHGAPVPLAEKRGAVALRTKDGRNIVIACSLDQGERRWVLVTDLDNGKSKQVWEPEEAGNKETYSVLLSSKGRFYTATGGHLLELDVEKLKWTICIRPAEVPLYLSFTEGRDGTVYAGGYESCRLIAIDPASRQAKDLGLMDPKEMYLSRLATDDKGWVYCGIGVARYNLVAFHPKTGEKRQLVDEAKRKPGTFAVSSGADGKAYGSFEGANFVLYDGAMSPLPAGETIPPEWVGVVNWGGILNRLPDGRVVSQYSLDGKWLEVSDPQAGKTRRIVLDYESAGPNVRFVFAGPGGKVWGASGHPPWTFTFDPKTGKTEILGRTISWQAADWADDRIYSAEYSGGWLSMLDTKRPWTGEGREPGDNPRLLAQYKPDINQPYAALVHPDGGHVLISGWPDYGYVGGGLAIYDLKTGGSQLLRHTELVRDQSTYQLAALPNGDIVAGTNISGGHGTRPVAKEGMLYILDWKTKSVVYRAVPVPGAEGVDGLVVARDGLVYAITTPPTLFVFDPGSREVIHRRDLAGYGNIAYNGFKAGPDGKLYAVMAKALLRITPGTYAVEKLAESPGTARAGTAVVGGRLYFTIGTHLWSHPL